MSASDDSLIFRDEKMFFNIVHTTPDDMEAKDMLKRAKHAVLREKAALVSAGRTKEDQAMSALLSRLNDEITYVHERIERVTIRQAIRAVCGEAVYQEIIAYLSVEQAKQREQEAA